MLSSGEHQAGRHRLVSIIMPTFNRLQYLPDSVASIFAQTSQDWELLIADDGSDAETKAYLQRLNDPPRVKLIHLPHTGKPAVARNFALREARGEYVAFMDSDDVWMPQKLEIQIASLRTHTNCEWSQTKFVLVDVGKRSTREMPVVNGWILGTLLSTATVIALPSVIVSRALLDRVGGFDEDLIMCEDYDLWLRLAAHSEVDAIDEPLTIVRRHGEHYGNPATSFRDSIRVLDKALRAGTASRYESVIRRERAKNSASLARCYATSGDRSAAVRMLFSTAPDSWRHPGWWTEALKATAAVLAPQTLRTIVRKHRRASR
jgi:glycosyltransferase involved in cell wall biosynthesis